MLHLLKKCGRCEELKIQSLHALTYTSLVVGCALEGALGAPMGALYR